MECVWSGMQENGAARIVFLLMGNDFSLEASGDGASYRFRRNSPGQDDNCRETSHVHRVVKHVFL